MLGTPDSSLTQYYFYMALPIGTLIVLLLTAALTHIPWRNLLSHGGCCHRTPTVSDRMQKRGQLQQPKSNRGLATDVIVSVFVSLCYFLFPQVCHARRVYCFRFSIFDE
jgi:hypothetical protein